LGQRLSAFDLDERGNLAHRRVWADLAPLGIVPDGICLDAEGAVWVANTLAPAAVRIAEGGEPLDTVTFSQPWFACMLGGPSGTTLFGMTAPSALPDEASSARRGRIESATVSIPH